MSSWKNFPHAELYFTEFGIRDPFSRYSCMRYSGTWQEELHRILDKIIGERTVTLEDHTGESFFKWIMARNDIREQIMSWLDSTKKNEKQSLKDPGKAKQYKEEGNLFFKHHDYRRSVESYTQSARYATFENNDFSVAIANRSAAFCHLGRYEESLQDIKLAIDCGYPAVSLWKLHLRAIECHVALGDNKSAQETMDKLSEWVDQNAEATSSMKPTILEKAKVLMARKPKKNEGIAKRSNFNAIINPETMLPKNEEFPFASSSVSLETCPKRGRRVVAAKPIKKGELLVVEKPFAWVPMTPVTGNDAEFCAHCCGPMDNSKIPCKGCLKALYCGRTCWENSWPYHQWECPSYQMNLWQQIRNLHLAFKVLIVSTTSSDIRRFNDVHKLMTNSDKTKSLKLLGVAIERFEGSNCTQCSGPSRLLKETRRQRCFDCGAASPANFCDTLHELEIASTLMKDSNDSTQKAYHRILAVQEKYLWKYNEHLVDTLFNLAEAYVASGDYLGALFHAEKGFLGTQERYGPDSIEVAYRLWYLTRIIILYLERTYDEMRTDVYRDTLKKGQEYVKRLGEIISLLYGPWCDMYRAKVEAKQKRLDQIDQWLRGPRNYSAFP